jgi:hypothetical protein
VESAASAVDSTFDDREQRLSRTGQVIELGDLRVQMITKVLKTLH